VTLAVAIFAFNRPESLRRLLTCFGRNPRATAAEVFVFIDGPRDGRDIEAVEQTAQVAEEFAGSRWRIVRSPVNKGLKRSVFEGVTEVCSAFGHAVVLEDDLVLSNSAIDYFSAALERYSDEERVWSICGYTYESPRLTSEHRTFFLPFAHPWGWATWQRAWSKFQFDPVALDDELLGSPTFRSWFDAGGLWRATDLLDLAQRGLVNSWFIRWHQAMFLGGGLSLFPSRRYVNNLGVGRGGTHASALSPYNLLLRPSVPTVEGVAAFPDSVQPDFLALDQMVQSREARAERLVAKLGRAKRLILSRKW
jgi:hypothetical protein